MGPAMISAEKKLAGKVDFVFVNVDNPKWVDLIEKYEVNGIPQLSFLNKEGSLSFSIKGLQSLKFLKGDTPLSEKINERIQELEGTLETSVNVVDEIKDYSFELIFFP